MKITVEQMLNSEHKIKGRDGIEMTGKEYLEDAARAFELNPFDYATTHFLLTKIAAGHNADNIITDIQDFHSELQSRYS